MRMEASMQSNTYNYDDILHLHCADCYKLSCTEQQNCKIIKCPFGCGTSYHGCKVDDHAIICHKMPRSCLNALYGCPYKIPRSNFAKHLNVCPASAVHCGMEWNRYPIYSKARKNWMPFLEENPPKIKGHLDIELAFNDQRKLEMENYRKMKIGKLKISSRKNRRRVDQERIKLLEIKMGKFSVDSSEGINQRDDDSGDFGLINDFKSMEASTTESPSEIDTSVEKNLSEVLSCGEPMPGVITEQSSDQSESLESSIVNAGNHQQDMIGQENHDRASRRDDEIEVRSAHENEAEELVFTVNVQEEPYHAAKAAAFVENTEYQITGFPRKYAECVASPYLTRYLGLNVMIETIPKFQDNYPMYSIPCQTFFRRDQYCAHFKNVHDDIHGGLNTWLQQRCPLAQYGCPYIRYRFRPSSKEGCLVYDQDIGGFAAKPKQYKYQDLESAEFCLIALPFEILEKIAEFLDSFGLIQFSKTCKTTRDVCRSLVQRRGIVLLHWTRGSLADGSITWKPNVQRWLFSPSFSYIREWKYTDDPSIGDHLRKCQFYDRNRRIQKCKFPMDGIQDVKLGYKEWRR